MKVRMRKYALALLFVMLAAQAAFAQPAQMPPADAGGVCRLAGAPPAEDPKNPQPKYESPYRQGCEDELAKDRAWWFELEARLRARVHRQASQEITTNNRHVVYAYAAMWLLAVGFVVFLWRRQQALKAELERLSRELKRAEGA
jgi:CcmD family protein